MVKGDLSRWQDNPLGVLDFLYWNHPWNSFQYPDRKSIEQAVAAMRKAHVGMVRMDFLWQDIEARPNEYDFAKYDFIVDTLTQNNIAILGVLSYHADWASPTQEWNNPAQDHSMFVNYCQKVASRYKDQVKYWEIWNEPDSSVYWKQQDGLVTYTKLLKQAYLALKKIDPQCQVLNGGLANGLSSVNRLYDAGARDYFDIMNIHAFQTPLDPYAVRRITAFVKATYKVMLRNQDGHKKIWVTETGCPGVSRRIRTKNWWVGKNPNETQQAQMVENTFKALLKSEHVEKIFWAFFRDTRGHWKDGTDHMGLLRNDFSEKPSYKAYQKISASCQAGK